MGRAYNVIDSDGHILEPLDLWENYIDPAFRDRAPRLFIDEDGKERLRIDGKAFGGRRGLGTLGAIGARDGVVCDDTMTYKEGRKGGFDPHARIPDMDADGIDAAFLYPSIGLSSTPALDCRSEASRTPSSCMRCTMHTTVGWRITANPIPIAFLASPCCPCIRSS
jgi:hypothetical protein